MLLILGGGIAGFFLKDIRNFTGKVDVFCFVYCASTATFYSMLKPGINYICIHLMKDLRISLFYSCSMYVHACRLRMVLIQVKKALWKNLSGVKGLFT